MSTTLDEVAAVVMSVSAAQQEGGRVTFPHDFEDHVRHGLAAYTAGREVQWAHEAAFVNGTWVFVAFTTGDFMLVRFVIEDRGLEAHHLGRLPGAECSEQWHYQSRLEIELRHPRLPPPHRTTFRFETSPGDSGPRASKAALLRETLLVCCALPIPSPNAREPE